MQIYKIINTINKKIYIGKDAKNWKNYYGSGKLINLAICKYGKKNFKKEIVEDNINDKKLLCEREKYWIKKLNSQSPNGYNITEGGDGFSGKHSKETILKLKGSWENKYGKEKADIMKEKLRKYKTNKKDSIEIKKIKANAQILRYKDKKEREKTSIAMKGKVPWNRGLNKKNDERISKMSKSVSKSIQAWWDEKKIN
ncbi:MAG: hypothetical protein JETCAE03_33720 [Ignavibacteriaceae bacterium]|jgi:group I intron endonuclease|nr:MAG: hypothetical protein JETCAE03_33720 [Ignavibacteriaceae bacterium]